MKRLLSCLVATLAAGSTLAASLEVTPTRIELGAENRSAVVTVRNLGNEPVVIQVEAMAWSQRDGRDEYQLTRDVLVTPPVTTIPARSDQIVRLALRRDPAATTELAYRLYVQEVPSAAPTGQKIGLQVRMRIGIPLFVAPLAGPAEPRLAWRVNRHDSGRYLLTAENSGTASVRLSELAVHAGGAQVAALNEMAYVLPGQRRGWLLPGAEAARVLGGGVPLRVQGLSHTGPLDAAIQPDPR